MENRSNNSYLKREVGLFSAFILVVANIVGTGIFTTSGFIIRELGNPQSMLLCWFLGGLFALSGALCYGELSAIFPRAGGEYVFLRESFGRGVAFLSGWISLIVGFSAPIAAASIAFATYLLRTLPASLNPIITIPCFGINILTISSITLLAAAIIIILSMIHYHGLLLGTFIQNSLTVFKITVIIAFIVAGLSFGNGSLSNLSEGMNLKSILTDKFAISLIFISFAYSGWNAAAYLGSEIKEPSRNIPLSLFYGTFFVMGLYLLLNILYIYALPAEEMSGVLEVGNLAAVSLFGEHVSRYFTAAIAIGILSALSAMIMTGPRVYYAMSRDGVFFKLFSKVSNIHRTPAHSIFLQAAIAVLMVITTSFYKLLLYIGFTLALFSMITVIGMIVLRIKEPFLEHPYRTFGYPITPLLFISGNLWIIYFSIKSKPIISLFGIGTIGLGFLFYLYFKIRNNTAKTKLSGQTR
ncbi:MAG: amino acid permease [Deltaproteobacteria bacterium CG12_big_fil_rev_8_21_14_0_65_43_10]|nr:MAG: amino acid permease [Deltaproteobacteria bacterium CG2_30_43_15]PIQ45140.1 MAG: amino acid permease [Deltaproteobacteria bacterium CG12_big_fil_rev_8_21_14_0_65_43_10]PIU84291.1 MAG: amino acid permease [Deltaproteobacteria bacterium CG06_land_8_20_14_3_00_44_19]PIX26641.1 MAG: amino acid permease [Deltaproteobacteria bacterium CG_4_8_14_3_um_filter_43_13]PIZ21221.1 MAG: amino acid permease [Deltaproteobacteria bacterium CG_4_10_14_0_8_um_filter_43_12]PJB44462.1 MAG: amino acid permeas